jgi:hypothetical protein
LVLCFLLSHIAFTQRKSLTSILDFGVCIYYAFSLTHIATGGRVYEIPGKLFQVPTAYVWIFTARLVTGQGLPYMAKEWATGAGVLFAVTTLARTLSVGRPWRSWIPGGIAVAVGE